jgi:hypothetical protein
MADVRKLCNGCRNIYVRNSKFLGGDSEDCVLVTSKLAVHKPTYDLVKKYWEKKLRNQESMDFICPGYNCEGI